MTVEVKKDEIGFLRHFSKNTKIVQEVFWYTPSTSTTGSHFIINLSSEISFISNLTKA